jgi:hypothetical protein
LRLDQAAMAGHRTADHVLQRNRPGGRRCRGGIPQTFADSLLDAGKLRCGQLCCGSQLEILRPSVPGTPEVGVPLQRGIELVCRLLEISTIFGLEPAAEGKERLEICGGPLPEGPPLRR